MMDTDEGEKDGKTTVTSTIFDRDADVTLPVNATFRYTTEAMRNATVDLGTTVTDTRTVPPLTTSTLLSVLSSTVRLHSTTMSSVLTSGTFSSPSAGIEVNGSTTTTLAPRNVTEVSNLYMILIERRRKKKRRQ